MEFNVKDLGLFVEFEGESVSKIEQYKKLLCLSDAQANSYYELYKENLPNLIHTESEMKFLLENLKETDMKNFENHNIKQYYLDTKNENVRSLINKTFANQVNFDYSEARVRIIDNAYYYLTLKSNETNGRKEMEKEIAKHLGGLLLAHLVKSLEKTRYSIFKNENFNFEIDFYKNRNLCVGEIEYNTEKLNEDNIKSFIGKYFEKNVVFTDVTHDKNFKNVNLAK